MRTLAAIALALASMFSMAGLPTLARADKCDDQAAAAGKGGKNWHWETIGGKKVQVIDTVISVCGKVPRPNVVYILQAKTINYEWENLKQDFLPLILASVKKAPF
jgi:hypothetical protein